MENSGTIDENARYRIRVRKGRSIAERRGRRESGSIGSRIRRGQTLLICKRIGQGECA